MEFDEVLDRFSQGLGIKQLCVFEYYKVFTKAKPGLAIKVSICVGSWAQQSQDEC